MVFCEVITNQEVITTAYHCKTVESNLKVRIAVTCITLSDKIVIFLLHFHQDKNRIQESEKVL